MHPNNLPEIDAVQNRALGAALVWEASREYQANRAGTAMPFSLTFLILPICLHTETAACAMSTRRASGLALFASKVGEQGEKLLSIHSRAKAMRELTMESLSAGVIGRLLSIDYKMATVRANDSKMPRPPERIRGAIDSASKLGGWFSALELAQITKILRVDF